MHQKRRFLRKSESLLTELRHFLKKKKKGSLSDSCMDRLFTGVFVYFERTNR